MGEHPLPESAPATRRPRWYAVRTSPRHEKKVRDQIAGRDIECFLPLYRTINRWKNGCRAQVDLPLFPSYLFVEFDARERCRILDVPGVVSLVGAGQSLWPLPQGEVEALRSGLHLHNPEPHAYITAGQKVGIKRGSLAGLVGFVVRKNDRLRVVLTVDTLMQGVAVEVDIDDIEAQRDLNPNPRP